MDDDELAFENFNTLVQQPISSPNKESFKSQIPKVYLDPNGEELQQYQIRKDTLINNISQMIKVKIGKNK